MYPACCCNIAKLSERSKKRSQKGVSRKESGHPRTPVFKVVGDEMADFIGLLAVVLDE